MYDPYYDVFLAALTRAPRSMPSYSKHQVDHQVDGYDVSERGRIAVHTSQGAGKDGGEGAHHAVEAVYPPCAGVPPRPRHCMRDKRPVVGRGSESKATRHGVTGVRELTLSPARANSVARSDRKGLAPRGMPAPAGSVGISSYRSRGGRWPRVSRRPPRRVGFRLRPW